MPAGVDGAEPGIVCPHNSYITKHEVYENREGVYDTIERLFRLLGASDAGLLSEKELDTLSVTELLTTKNELKRQENERTKREYERAKLEAQSNQQNNGNNYLGVQ